MNTLHQTNNFHLLHDPLQNWLYATWTGTRSAEVMHAQYLLILQHVRQTKSIKLLNDSLEDKDGWGELTNWLAEYYFGELAESGVQAVAWVLPADMQAFRHTQKVLTLVQAPLVDVFHDALSAYDWLMKWPMSAAAK